jgi:hypothetical protein
LQITLIYGGIIIVNHQIIIQYNMNTIKSVLFLTSLLLFAAACSSGEPSSFEKKDLLGRWELERAWRNGKQTETLTGTFYSFTDAGVMTTNLTPRLTEENFSFTLSGDEILQQATPPVTYKVESLSDSSMVLTMTINNFPFRLQLKKAM